MESLYVIQFSNGHIKVGRTIDPNSRIAAHAERVRCLGVEPDKSYVTECPDSADRRERLLIDRCADLCSQRFQSEWFTGLNFDDVCKWAYEFAHTQTLEAEAPKVTRWTKVIEALRCAGWTRAQLATECKCGQATISRLALGQQDEPMYSMGETLLRLQTLSSSADASGVQPGPQDRARASFL